jgi:alpha-methylacyl-CoA racemase
VDHNFRTILSGRGVNLLDGLVVVSTALNLPGPVACARLRDLGARVVKVEPPAGDPFESFCPTWYERLHADIEVRRLDLKSNGGRETVAALLASADVLVTAQRASALERLGLGAQDLRARFPRLCHVAITGHAPPNQETPGHDLTYLAAHGLVSPPALPPTLFADMAGAERAVSTALALVIARNRTSSGHGADVPLADAAKILAQPLSYGLTARGALLGGGHAGYNLYEAKRGWIAVAALEPHFERRLAEALDLPSLDTASLAAAFAREDASYWQSWAAERDLPLVEIRSTPEPIA